jgi:YidC/Oxa1 family membrane protein insertase
MEKRTLLAFVLMALVLVVSQYLFRPPTPPPEEVRRAAEREGADPGALRRAPSPVPAPAPPAAARAADPAGAEFAAPGKGSVRVDTPLYQLTIDRGGGAVTGVFLKRYRSYVDSLPVQLVPPGSAFFHQAVLAGGRTLELTDLTFSSDRESLEVAEGSDSLVLEARLPGGEPLRQTFRFESDSYEIDYRLEAGSLAAPGARLETRVGPRLRSTEKNLKEDLGSFAAVVKLTDRVETVQPEDVAEGPQRFRGAASWAALKSKYFLGALLAGEEPFTSIRVSAVPADTLPGLGVTADVPLETGRAAYRLYIGPQEYRRLAALGMEDVNQYGWSWIRWMIQPFAHLIVRILVWMHQYVANYGVVLVIFGILVRVLLWPLTQKSFESMQRMQAIQPELTRLRERYKNDPQKMQQEMMRLYRERGVNPLGGCLPNLLPLPVLFALFFVFQSTIEFRGAPFVGWIQDLSRPDPYFILPVLMGVTMFVQQKLTTPSDNPQMKLMLYFMPVFLTFIFLNLASGLVLYYTVSNVLTFLQQILIKRRSAAGAAASVPARS